VAEREDVRSQREHGADLLGRELVSDRHRMRSKEPMLESCGVIGRETHVRQEPETGRHAIDDGPFFDSRDDDLPSSIDPS